MAFFGEGRVMGVLHPSLRTFIDCFCSTPMPKIYPRGGGPHNQDPILMRDFREILKIKGQCEEMEEAMREAKERSGASAPSGIGGGSGLEAALDQYIQEQEE